MGGIRIYRPQLVWTPGDPEIAAALAAELERWRGTPYESGQSFPQRGADCTGSVFGVVDAMDGRARMAPPGFPHDASMHDRAGAIATVREIVRRYSPCHKVEPVRFDEEGQACQPTWYVEPGDIVVTGLRQGGPGHVELVGPRKNELWHAQPSTGFVQGGWGFFQEQVLYAVYRIEDKHRWRQDECTE